MAAGMPTYKTGDIQQQPLERSNLMGENGYIPKFSSLSIDTYDKGTGYGQRDKSGVAVV